jgi:glycerol-3-phosphate dehydrogenase
VLYFDGQFDDARPAIDMAKTAVDQGGTVLNYCSVEGLLQEDDFVCGVRARDLETGTDYELRARCVVNATGVFADELRRRDDPEAVPIIRASQGIHLVLDGDFLPGESAIMVPQTDDGRVLFAIPWLGKVVVGTTDTPMDSITAEPRPLPEEIDFLLRHCARYMTRDPGPADVRSVFAGLRPLVGAEGDTGTAGISRDHHISVSRSGLVTIAGGKWTTYRRMAADTIDQAAIIGGLPAVPCPTAELNIHGNHPGAERFGALARYGSDAVDLQNLLAGAPDLREPLCPGYDYVRGEVVWAAREEMARTVADVLARRTRLLLLDARRSIELATDVAGLLAAELGRDDDWIAAQVDDYTRRAGAYLIAP